MEVLMVLGEGLGFFLVIGFYMGIKELVFLLNFLVEKW